MKQRGVEIEVMSMVETPEIHILGRSSSSLQDQRTFTDPQRQSLSEFRESILADNGVPISDIVQYFHGDGPAQQFESGNKIGGNYCCVGCEAHCDRFNDLAHCFRARHLTLS